MDLRLNIEACIHNEILPSVCETEQSGNTWTFAKSHSFPSSSPSGGGNVIAQYTNSWRSPLSGYSSVMGAQVTDGFEHMLESAELVKGKTCPAPLIPQKWKQQDSL